MTGSLRRFGAAGMFAALVAFFVASTGSAPVGAQVCTFTLSPASLVLTSPGARTGVFEVTTAAGCAWSASVTTGGTFVAVTSVGYVDPDLQVGPGLVAYTVQANTEALPRSAAITISGHPTPFAITQPASLGIGPDIVAGDVFAGLGSWTESSAGAWAEMAGAYRVLDAAGNHKEDVLTGGFATTGCADDWRTGDVVGTLFDVHRWVRIAPDHPHAIVQQFEVGTQTSNELWRSGDTDDDLNLLPKPKGGSFKDLPAANPESVVFGTDPATVGTATPRPVMYIGNAGGNRDIHRFVRDTTGQWVFERAYDVGLDRNHRGTDWMDLLSDQRTLLYTSEGVDIFALDVTTGTVTPFLFREYEVDGVTKVERGSLGKNFAFRVLPPGNGDDILVANPTVVFRFKRLTPGGPHRMVQHYDIEPGHAPLPTTTISENSWFALNVPHTGTSFYSANVDTGNLYHFDIATGALLAGPINVAPKYTLTGLCVKQEYTAAQELCDNGIDEDGDGTADENCTPLRYPNDNRPPTISAPGARDVVEGQTIEIPFTIGDPNDPLTALTVTVVATDLAGVPLPVQPSFALTGTGATRTLVWIVPYGSFVTLPNLRFKFTVADREGLSETAITQVRVLDGNVAPTIASPPSIFVAAGTTNNIMLTVADANDPASALTVWATTSADTPLPVAFNHSVSGTGATRTFTWTTPSFVSGWGIKFHVSDPRSRTGESISIVQVRFTPVAQDQNVRTPEETSTPATVVAVDGDPGDTLVYQLVSGPANGTLSPVPGGGGTVTYTPKLDYVGPDAFTFKVTDSFGFVDEATVHITVTPVNDPPVAKNDTITTAEDTPASGNVLSNDSDVDGDTLSAVVVTPPTNGTLALNSNGAFTYSPNANYHGPDSFTYSISDGNGGSATATAAITVTSVNDAPVANGQSITTAEDTAKAITLTASDVDGDALTFSIVTGPTKGTLAGSGAAQTYTPNLNYYGTDAFTFQARDASGTTSHQTVAITVTPVNDPPTLAPVANVTVLHGTPVVLTLSGADVDLAGPLGDTLTFSTSSPLGTLNPATGAFSWTPTAAQVGPYTIIWTVTDAAGASATQTSTINVINNQMPVCSAATVSPSTLLWPPNHKEVPFTIAGVQDPDGDPVTIQILSILQDEPTNTRGDGNTTQDAGITGPGTGWVRSERIGVPQGPGNGRVYLISFTATDNKGGACTSPGVVTIGMPHDMRPGAAALLDPARYDSMTGVQIQ